MKKRSLFQHRSPHYRIAAADDGAVEIQLYDEIGYFGISARDFVSELKDVTAERIDLRVNSPGGDVFDGVAIYNALREHPAEVVSHIDGLAASIASIIALAGDKVVMAENAFFMIHNPWGITLGDATEHRKTADVLEKIGGTLVATYELHSGAARSTIEDWMDDETWFTAEEAEEAGFVEAIGEEAPKAAAALQFDLSVFEHAPAALAARAGKPTVRDVERLLREAGFSRSEAHAMASHGMRALTQREAGDEALDELNGSVRELITTLSS